jgi:transitional endoplasmic reticulum ATPase
MVVLRKVISDLNLQSDDPLSEEILERLVITPDDFTSALKVVRPSALREVLIEKPSTKWVDIGGLEDAKQELQEAVEWPLQNKAAFARLGISPPTGVLLYGPPGTGKTLLAKAVANESKANFILVNGPELMSKWVGESEKAVRKIFEKARQSSPSIIFFDEIDSLVPKRGASQDSSGVSEKVVNQLLTEMNGLQEMKDVVVIGATNRPDLLDSALLRPGRFDRIVLVSVPDVKARREVFDVHLKHIPRAKDVKVEELVQKTEGYVGADIEAVCREAAMLALREDMTARDVKMKHFNEALKKVRPSASKDIEAMYAQFNETFRKTRAEEMKDKPSYYG